MNRNKKPFKPGMRVAVLYLLMGVLLLLAVTLFSGRESMRATEEYFDRTIRRGHSVRQQHGVPCCGAAGGNIHRCTIL